MKKLTTTHRTGAALAVLGIACASIAACGSDDEASNTATSSDTTEVAVDESTVDTVAEPAATEPAATEPATTEPAATEPATTEPEAADTSPTDLTADGLAFLSDLDLAITEPAISFCEAFGNLDEPDGVDRLMALESDDIVIEDMLLGETYRGREDVRAWVAGLYDTFGIDGAVCPGDAVQGASWTAGPYELWVADTVLSQGIAAVRVDDEGLIEHQVNFYTPSPDGSRQANIDQGTGVFSIGMQYCSAWGDPYDGDFSEDPDPDRIVSLMSAEPTIHGATTLTGAEQIRTFAEDAVWDRNECSLEVQAVQWEAVANRFFDDDTGTVWEGVNVVALDADELVTDHWPFQEVVS